MHLCLILAATLLPAADDPKVKADLATAQGTWAIESVEHDGKDASDEVVKQLFKSGKVVIKADKLSVVAGDVKLVETTLVLDPNTKPRCIDFKDLKGPVYQADLIEGVYELDKDTARVCVYVQGDEKKRPTEFQTAAGSHRYLFVLKRDKP